jgi:site-specific recombinase XerD
LDFVINEILQEIKSKCDPNTYNHLNSFITVKLNGYRLIKMETGMVKYEMTESEKWFKMFFISKKLQGLSERTLKVYKYEITRFLLNMKKPLKDITTDDVRYYLACYQLSGKVKQTTIDNTRRYLNTFFQWFEDEEYIAKNPCKKIKKVKQKKKVKKAFKFEEIERLRMAYEKIEKEIDRKRTIAMVEFLLSTGVRAEELTNVKLVDINFDTGEVMITGKGNKERIVYLNATSLLRLKDYLKERQGQSEYVFLGLQSPYGKIGVSVVETTVRKLGKEAGINKVHPHRFRRTCATIARKRGMPIEEISKMLGHEDLGTTQIYVQIDEDDIKKSHEKYMN